MIVLQMKLLTGSLKGKEWEEVLPEEDQIRSDQMESFIALVAGCMSVIMELLWRFDLGFETSDYISGKLLAGRGMQSHDYKLFSFAPWRGMLRGSCHFSIAPLYRFI